MGAFGALASTASVRVRGRVGDPVCASVGAPMGGFGAAASIPVSPLVWVPINDLGVSAGNRLARVGALFVVPVRPSGFFSDTTGPLKFGILRVETLAESGRCERGRCERGRCERGRCERGCCERGCCGRGCCGSGRCGSGRCGSGRCETGSAFGTSANLS